MEATHDKLLSAPNSIGTHVTISLHKEASSQHKFYMTNGPLLTKVCCLLGQMLFCPSFRSHYYLEMISALFVSPLDYPLISYALVSYSFGGHWALPVLILKVHNE